VNPDSRFKRPSVSPFLAPDTYHIRYICLVNPGEIVRQRRITNGLTQAQLALRARSTQAAISRLERGELSPTFETFERLLAVMGEEADVEVRRTPADFDRARLATLRARTPAERLSLAISWNRLAGRLGREGARARGELP
jgi:transcriptional regulator with XRE-family HTH domain